MHSVFFGPAKKFRSKSVEIRLGLGELQGCKFARGLDILGPLQGRLR